jgi:glycosyltransferase involved in cell wall biosynthesis
MGYKNREDVNQVLNILKIKKLTEGFQLAVIENKTESEVAQILRESLIFLSFGRSEGFSLPPMEAMLCGCIVIGYHGGGGREYFHPDLSYSVEADDIIGFAKTIEAVLTAYNANPAFILEKGKKASEYISGKYNAQYEETDLVAIWSDILGRNPR